MMKMKFVAAFGAALSMCAVASSGLAQDDLDDLLKDLEGESKTQAKSEAKAEVKAEAKAEVKAEAKAEEKTEAQVEEKAEEKPAAQEEAKEEAKVEEKAETKPEASTVAQAAEKTETKPEAKADEKDDSEKVIASILDDLAKEASVTPTKKTAQAKPATATDAPAKAAPAKVAAKPKAARPDAELIENLATTERLRRESLDTQAQREIMIAREAMDSKDYIEAVRHYGLADKLLNDSPASKELRRECRQGVAEGLFRAAMQEESLGRHAQAVEYMQKARDMRHPKAGRQLDKWSEAPAVDVAKTDFTDIAHRQNEADYKKDRADIRRHLKRARQYLALRDMEKALEECEVVLKNDPYNQEAIRVRNAIQKKRQTVLQQERKASRDGMIADVDEAWRPVYAVNAAQLSETVSETVKTQAGEDPERTQEQEIEKRMREMRLPTIEFKPPATIIEAVEFFRTASKDYDRPDIPLEKRGFNFVLRTPVGAIKQQAAAQEESSDDFASNESGEKSDETANGLPPIPKITASDITFYDALKLVCDSVDYKFIVRGPIVMVMQKDMSTAELLSRKYNVPEAFMERVSSASDEMKEMGGFGGGNNKKKEAEEADDSEDTDAKWKSFFEKMGVKWPEGSHIKHIKTLGKLFVRNTRENLAEFEKVLDELGGQPQLIEIETRFVEVSQQDLNSLGFEWILNSDYSLNVGDKLGKALGVGTSTWGSESGSYKYSQSASSGTWGSSTLGSVTGSNGVTTPSADTGSTSGQTSAFSQGVESSYSKTITPGSSGGSLVSDDSSNRNIGINAFGGTSSQQNGNRYLSTTGNHISGESKSTNDQFMKVNAFLGEADLSMILHMLSQRSDTDLLSAPKVVTKSGEQAVIKVVTEYIYPQDYNVQLQSSSSSGGGSSGSSGGSSSAILAVVEPQNFTMREVGVILDVVPTYSEANGGTIDLELKPSVVDEPTWYNYGMSIPFTGNPSTISMPGIGWITDLGDEATKAMSDAMIKLIKSSSDEIATSYVSAGISSMNPSTLTYYEAPMKQPFFPVRSLESKVSITPGATVVMGGLITEQRKAMDDKIPFLGDLPYVGRLFRSHAEQTIKRNLLIFVTGRLITPAGRELQMNNAEQEPEAGVKPAPRAE